MTQQTAIFKFNGGEGALLCSKCKVIIKIGKDFTEEEKQAIKGYIKLPSIYCEKCKIGISDKTKHMAQQTAVEWLILQEKSNDYFSDEIIKKALQMEKEQHYDTWTDSRIECKGDGYVGKEKTFEQYYNETYGKE